MADTGLIATFTNIGQSNAIPLTALQQGESAFSTLESEVSQAVSEHTVLIISLISSALIVGFGGYWYLKKKGKIK